MTPYERLLAEAIPTRPPAKPPGEPWTPEEQAQHLADLEAELASIGRERRQTAA
ncbi:hypothetical protein ACJ6WF_16005 [Streptomyces sp. MMS24-I2-30]|uniref:hypothetical protein n=1 Tax=Streptomyces sp. MMS24-I2-30 TaxID=3351564 RepID=UPI003896C2D9